MYDLAQADGQSPAECHSAIADQPLLDEYGEPQQSWLGRYWALA